MMNISSSNVKNYTAGGFQLSATFKNVGIAMIVSVLLLFVFAFIITFTPFPENAVSPGIVLILVLSNLIGGWLTAKDAQNKGWLNGAVAGGMYMLLLFIISSFMHGFRITTSSLLLILFGLVAGAAGGIFGVNARQKQKRR